MNGFAVHTICTKIESVLFYKLTATHKEHPCTHVFISIKCNFQLSE